MPNCEDRTTRKILLAAPRGFCAGVDRAIRTVEIALETYGAPVYVRKQIVHNTHVVADLSNRGAIFVEEVDEVPEGSVLVFSAHGVSPAVRTASAERDLRTIDATCPLVTKVHQEVVRYADAGYDVLLVGHEGHEEVDGTLGEAPDRVRLVDTERDVAEVAVADPGKVVWLSQTTLTPDEVMHRVDGLRTRFPLLENPPSSDICYASLNRQAAVERIAPECDLVLVVGSRNSSNSLRLVEVALRAGARAAHLVDGTADLDESWLDGVGTVGITAGASAPEHLVRQVIGHLAERGWPRPDEVVTAEEGQVFALPRDLHSSS
ncbi:4-hydroxy-3-methylbut-2-enyl diphosphate reductase [Lentzea sp. BCCO 10_0061]|uniref:4-hydroxy-3-methylbut-2-enyl diphosphate reductase n=1 Tax=Lentzea sokolovensis TaxID=3095429 RepID=A0ABU4VCI1_9PSEU|nr:4-hydroxy-3-methylbut-2-enyl diphosphate reductase [Lentzea sp. BCCO 10_0061]MDX8149485.1 4-hydroxy-3-methylbut-2-enyl diphosphate reductase [Lentzea sp. BCCO 10_0061]